ncbi:MAG: hypothetical protein QM753_09805 [Thermomicrobiales bacterium]
MVAKKNQDPPKDDEPLPSYAFPMRDGEPLVTMELVNQLRDEEPIPGQWYKGVLLAPKHGERRPVTSELVRELMDEFP